MAEEHKYAQYGKKRKRLVNQITGGMLTPPKKMSGVIIENGNLEATCPGTHETREVIINIKNNKYEFKCSCAIYDSDNIESCTHINSVLLKILNDYIDNSVYFEEKKDKFLELKKEFTSLMQDFDKLDITQNN